MAGMNINTRSDSELHLVPRRDVGAKYFPALKLATTSTLSEPWTLYKYGRKMSDQPGWYAFKPSETVLSYRSGSAYQMEQDPLFMADTYGEFRRAVLDEGVPKSDYDNGHPFVSRSIYLQPAQMFTHSVEGGKFSASFSPLPYVPTFMEIPTIGRHEAWRNVSVTSATKDNLDVWGTNAFNKVVPTKPQMSVATFLGELVKDGFPSLVGLALGDSIDQKRRMNLKDYAHKARNRDKSRQSKALAGEHLNYQFAVKPLLADLKSFYRTVRDFNSILGQYERDSGRLVRRQRYEEMPITTEKRLESKTLAASYHLGNTDLYPLCNAINDTTFERTRYQSYSFSGGFMYYVPTDPGLMNNLVRIESNLKKLFGAPLSPEVVWNLMPWTWLSDWLANVGTILGNYQALQTDDLVMKYGYVTRRTVLDLRITTSLVYQAKPNAWRRKEFGALSQFAETIRQPATPFGFGLSSDAFSPRQWSILAALGFTLGPQAFKKSS